MSARRAEIATNRPGWLAFTVPPVAWMAQLILLYLLVPVACQQGRAPLHLVTAAALAAALGSVVPARGRRRRASGGEQPLAIVDVARIQSGFFLFAITLTGAAALWIDPCA